MRVASFRLMRVPRARPKSTVAHHVDALVDGGCRKWSASGADHGRYLAAGMGMMGP